MRLVISKVCEVLPCYGSYELPSVTSINVKYISSESSRVLHTAQPSVEHCDKAVEHTVYSTTIIFLITIVCGKPWFCVLVIAVNLLFDACFLVIPVWHMRNMHCRTSAEDSNLCDFVHWHWKARQALIHSSNKESKKMALKTGCKTLLLTYQDPGDTIAQIPNMPVGVVDQYQWLYTYSAFFWAKQADNLHINCSSSINTLICCFFKECLMSSSTSIS